MKNKVSTIIRLVVSFGLLGLLFWLMRREVHSIWRILLDSDLRFLAIAFFTFLINLSFLAWRLKIIFLGEDLDLTFMGALQLTFIGYFFNNFMPTAVGGDIIKAHYAANINKQRVKSYASVLMDRFIGLYSFVVIAAVALIVDQGRFGIEAVRFIVFFLLVFGFVGAVIATNKRIANFMGGVFTRLKMFRLGEKLNSVYQIVHDYRNRPGVVVKSFLMSIGAQSFYFLIIYLFFRSLGTNMNIGNIFLIMPVVTVISMVPSVGGLGVREGAMVAFFAPLAGRETAFAVSLLLLLGLFLISFVGGVIYLGWGFSKERAGGAEEEEAAA